MITREVDATPHASALIEGRRDFGYSLDTALADIIDNSISAGATEVSLIAETASENPFMAIADNGLGMSEPELVDAMRLGSKNPTDIRAIALYTRLKDGYRLCDIDRAEPISRGFIERR